MSSKGKVASVRVKDLNVFQLTPGLADALSASVDASGSEVNLLVAPSVAFFNLPVKGDCHCCLQWVIPRRKQMLRIW
jgi:hypothetical protein